MSLTKNSAWRTHPELVCINPPISQDTFTQAMEFYTTGNYSMTLHLLIPMAEQNKLQSFDQKLKAKAYAWIGYMKWKGRGINKNYKEAYRCFEYAYLHGNQEGTFWLASIYYDGCPELGISVDYHKSYKISKVGADAGSSICQYRLGIMCHCGDGVQQSNEEAFKWATLSADQGDCKGECLLAKLYNIGAGVLKDTTKAFQLAEKSAKAGNQSAQTLLAQFYVEGICVNKSYSNAYYWATLAANKGSVNAIQIVNAIQDYHRKVRDKVAVGVIPVDVGVKRSREDNTSEEVEVSNKKIKYNILVETTIDVPADKICFDE
jgi:TPR repeat protein